MDAGTLGAIVGSTLGVAGGAIGTYGSIHGSRSASERRFMVRASVLLWTAGSAFLVVIVLASTGVLPRWTFWAGMAVWFGTLGPSIAWMSRRVQRLREPGAGLVRPDD